MSTVSDLGKMVKAKYPGAYDDMPDDEVGRAVKAKHPGAYDDFSDAPAAPSAPARVGMGDVQASPSSYPDTSNVPAAMLTGDPAADSQIAQNLAARGQRHAITKRDALGAGAVGLGAVVGTAAGVPAAMASGALMGGGMRAQDPEASALDIGASGVLGGTLSGALARFAPPVAKYLGEKLGSLAEKAAVRSTNADRTAFRRAFKGDEVLRHKLGRFMLEAGDSGLPLRTPASIRDAAQGIQDTIGPEISALAGQADNLGVTVDLGAAVNAAKASRALQGLGRNTVTQGAYEQVVGMLDDQVARHGDKVSPSVAHDIRMQLDQLANWDQAAPAPLKEAWRAARGAVNDALNSSMSGAGLGDAWSKVNETFRLSRLLSNPRTQRGLADIGAERRIGNRLGSPVEQASGLAGAVTAGFGNPVTGIVIPATTVAVKRFGAPATARTANFISKTAPEFVSNALQGVDTGAKALPRSAISGEAGAGVEEAVSGAVSKYLPRPRLSLAVADRTPGSAEQAQAAPVRQFGLTPALLGKMRSLPNGQGYADLLDRTMQKSGPSGAAQMHFLLYQKDPTYRQTWDAAQKPEQ